MPPLLLNLKRNSAALSSTSVILRCLCTGLLALVAIGAVAAAISAFAGRLTSVSFYGQSIPLADLAPRGRSVVALVSLLTGVVLVKALHHLRRSFG